MLARALTLLAIVLPLAALGCDGSEPPPGPSTANPLDDEENKLLYEINRFREDQGVAKIVTACASLNESASAHADDMRDKGYLSDTGKDGSTPRDRACAAGYAPACDASQPFAELISSGVAGAKDALAQWTAADNTRAILLNDAISVAGVGRALGNEEIDPTWALDLSAISDASCQ